jgi:tetratricopeptide (TPR) repeat protein
VQGGDKAKEASLIFKELSDRAGSDPLPLVNGLAAAYMSQRRWEDAEKLLAEAHARAPGDVDTLVNLAACAAQGGRAGEAGAKWLPLLREAAAPGDGGVPNTSAGYVAQLELAEGMFDRVAASYAISQQ